MTLIVILFFSLNLDKTLILVFSCDKKTSKCSPESVVASTPETQPTCKMVIGLCASFHKVFAIRKPSKRLQRGKVRMVAFAVSIIVTANATIRTFPL